MVMISMRQLKIANEELEAAKDVAAKEAPKADFIPHGIDEKYVYFSIVGMPSVLTEHAKKELSEKTRFEKISENIVSVSYRVEMHQ